MSRRSSDAVHEKFVDDLIAELVQCGSAREVGMAEVCVVPVSPLGVFEGRKLRLVLDLLSPNDPRTHQHRQAKSQPRGEVRLRQNH